MKNNVIDWASKKNLIKKENSTVQVFKLIEESSEIFKAYLSNNVDEIKDGIGDTQVVLYILFAQLEMTDEILPFQFKQKDIESNLFEFNRAISNVIFSYKYIYNQEKVSVSSVNVALGYLKNIANFYGSTLEDCLELAWNEIKDRKGKTINGTFIKNK